MDKKIISKLTASILALVLAASLVATTSYAWLTLSGSPEVDGIQITVGGSNTILVAPDIVGTEEDGSISHYPGAFGERLNFLQHDSYDYLRELTGLMPVSTSDGVNWFLPAYYEVDDSMVQCGQAYAGQLKDISEFTVDTSLKYANLTDRSEAAGGHYAYLDFWVMSPADGYRLRVSTGSEEEGVGSYVISLPEPVVADTDSDGAPERYVLAESDETAAASIRVGFLVSGEDSGEGDRFTVYEPNGDLHPADGYTGYRITRHLGISGGIIGETDISKNLTVQKKSVWKAAGGDNVGDTMIAQEFQTAIVGKDFGSNSPSELKELFYKQRLAGQLAPYLTIGRFVSNTGNLWATAQASGGQLNEEAEALTDVAGATDDVYITTLRKNVPIRIRMFVWIEGQDEDCGNHAASDFAVNIELAGSNEK